MSDLSVREVADELGVCYHTAFRLLPKLVGVYSISHGKQPRYRVPMSSVIRFKRDRATSLKQTNVANIQKMSSSNLEGQDAKL